MSYIKKDLDISNLPPSMGVTIDAVTQRLHATIGQVKTTTANLKDQMTKPQAEVEVVVSPRSFALHRSLEEDFKGQQYQQSEKRGDEDPFSLFRTSSKYQQHIDMSQAIFKGDEKVILSSLRTMLHQAELHGQSPIQDQHNRRASVVSRQEQCEQLVKCAEGLTLYDIVLFFYRDNIDFDKGEFDDGAIRNFDEGFFDEATLLDKASRIFTKAGNARTSNFDDNSCNDLLQEFHQVIETGENLFVWKGGVVTDVCLASGSVEYLGLESIAQNVSKTVADFIFEDVLLCSRQLFDTNDRGETDFVFVDPVSNTLRLPTGIKGDLVGATPNTPTFENRDRHGKPMSYEPTDYFTFRSISEGGYCDSLFLFAN